jgi:UMF1 family MFS transporter
MRDATEPKPAVTKAGIVGWVLFDPAAQPHYTLITTFVFAPFFANYIAANPVAGQAAWGYAAGAAGIVIAILAPVMGAIADASGSRKSWIAFFSVFFVIGATTLWFAVPGAAGAMFLALAGYILASIGAEFATVFTNAMMPDLVDSRRLGRLSGIAWAAGYVGGLLSLVIVLGFLAANPETGRTLLGITPLFGLDPATHAGDRVSGPFTALWYLALVWPLFLFTPDRPRMKPLGIAVRSGIAALNQTLRGIHSHRNTLRFLIAHMIYADGLIALFAFSGIYAASVFGWRTIELGLLGILLTITGALGGVVGGILDDRFGSKAVVIGALLLLFLSSCAILSIDRTTIFFVVDVAPLQPGDALFASAGERLFLVLAAFIGIAAGPLQAASRVIIVHVSPKERMTEFFGLFALSGKLTSFLGPIAVGLVTTIFASQRIGIAVILAFFAVGGVVLAGVRVDRKLPH